MRLDNQPVLRNLLTLLKVKINSFHFFMLHHCQNFACAQSYQVYFVFPICLCDQVLSLRKKPTFCDATTAFRPKWHLRNKYKNSILMRHHYLDLGSASDWSCCMGNLRQSIRSSIQIWIVARHQYGISGLVSQTSFHRESSCGITCFPFVNSHCHATM